MIIRYSGYKFRNNRVIRNYTTARLSVKIHCDVAFIENKINYQIGHETMVCAAGLFVFLYLAFKCNSHLTSLYEHRIGIGITMGMDQLFKHIYTEFKPVKTLWLRIILIVKTSICPSVHQRNLRITV